MTLLVILIAFEIILEWFSTTFPLVYSWLFAILEKVVFPVSAELIKAHIREKEQRKKGR